MDSQSKIDLQLIAPDPAVHSEELCDLCAKTFSTSGYYRARDNMHHGRILKSHYDWQASRIGLSDGRIVTHWGIYDMQMRVGTASLRVAAVGLVATDADFRGRGLMDRTARATIAANHAAGYDMTFLTGIDNYYSKFGYVRSWPYETYFVKVGEILHPPASSRRGRERGSAITHRPYKFEPRPDLWKLYNREHAGIAGTAVHPTFQYCKTPSWSEGLEWKRGVTTTGYMIVEARGESLAVVESAGAVDAVLNAAGAEARKRGCKTVEFPLLPRLTRLATALRQRNCRVEISYKKDGAAMMRTINLRSSLEKLAPELSRRLKSSLLAKWSGSLLIEDARERVVLAIRRGRVSVGGAPAPRHAIRGGEQIVQLLIGTDHPEETVRAAGIKLRGDAALLLLVLFPCQYPQMPLSDQI